MLTNLEKRIIYMLGKDARLSYKDIAQRIHSQIPIVAYHIKKLEEQGIIWKYVPVLSLTRLGIYAYKMYFRFKGLDKEHKEILINELCVDKRINWVASATGPWDLLVGTYVNNVMEFAQYKNQLLHSYGKYIEEYAVTMLEDALVFNRDYLVNKKLEYRKEFVFGGSTKLESIDDAQKDILRKIFNNGTFQVTKLSQELKLNVRTVISKIRDLEKKEIIQGYTTFMHIYAIGLKFFKIIIYLSDFTQAKYTALVNFCKINSSVIHIIKSIGQWELEVEIETETVETVYDFIDRIKIEHPYTVRKIDLVIITKEHKLDFFPEWY